MQQNSARITVCFKVTLSLVYFTATECIYWVAMVKWVAMVTYSMTPHHGEKYRQMVMTNIQECSKFRWVYYLYTWCLCQGLKRNNLRRHMGGATSVTIGYHRGPADVQQGRVDARMLWNKYDLDLLGTMRGDSCPLFNDESAMAFRWHLQTIKDRKIKSLPALVARNLRATWSSEVHSLLHEFPFGRYCLSEATSPPDPIIAFVNKSTNWPSNFNRILKFDGDMTLSISET